jgi:hypothetical protein
MEEKEVTALWIFRNWLDILRAVKDEKDRARVWLLLIEDVFGERKVNLEEEKTEIQIAYNALRNLARMRKLGGRKQNNKPKEEDAGLRMIRQIEEEDRRKQNGY